MSERIRGVLAPVLTPFKADLSPHRQRFIAHCKWLLSQNCGLAVFGTNSEANSLSMEERTMLLDELVAAKVDPSACDAGNGSLLDHGNGQAYRTGGRVRLRGRADAAAFLLQGC